MANFRLSAKSFSALDTALRKQAREYGTRQFSDRTREIARAVIVEGKQAGDVAREFDMTRQRVNQLVTRYYEGLLTSGLPEADVVLWLKHGFEVPSTVIEPLETFFASARRSRDTEKVQAALRAVIKVLAKQRSTLE